MPAKRASKPITITLPAAMARKVKARVASGAYESASEVIREGLRALDAQEAALEQWLKTEGAARLRDLKAGKAKFVPLDAAFDAVIAKIGKRGRRA
ncbi:MAG: type II toxin-antitoxin system ParD family antitoxin [Hydrogenophilaceae bacterium]|jgi:putative addiction module CopG family antidote|nr:type II toxin-antitoxin system ParD family antitoxin [Hydrogenophilaceae bacterium]